MAKSYDIVRTYFKFSVGLLTFQLRKLYMTSTPSGFTTVFTVSTSVR